MKKSIIALLLVVSMVLSFSLTALASAGEADDSVTTMDDLTVTTFFNEKTSMVPLKSGEGYTIEFHNKTNEIEMPDNAYNFVLGVVGDNSEPYAGASKAILIVRADNWGWGGEMSDIVVPGGAGNSMVFDCNINWDQWIAACQAGFDVKIAISRIGDTFLYEATINDWYSKTTVTSGKSLPETVYVFLTGEKCTLTNIKFTKGSVDTTNGFGFSNLTLVGWHSANSPMVPLNSGDSYTFKFHNQSNVGDGWANWHIFSLFLKAPDNKMVMQIRGDNWETGGDEQPYFDNISSFTSVPDFETWQTDATAGFDVEATLSREGDTLTYTAKMGDKYTMTMTDTAKTTLDETIYVYLTGEQCNLTGIRVIKNVEEPTEPEPTDPSTPTEPETSEPEPTLPQPTDPQPTEPEDDSVVIEGFNSQSAGTVTLKDGASAKFTFHNQSTGDLNWHNFVFIISGINASGTNENVINIRADNYAWGDPKTYFDVVFGEIQGLDAEDGWGKWLAEAKTGFDVEVTISRVGNTLNYEAKMGEGWKYTDTMTLTSASDLPDTITVSLTGEKCVLSHIFIAMTGITSENIDDAKTEKVELADGNSYTYTFNSEVAGEAGDAKDGFVLTVADSEKAILRIFADGSFGNVEESCFTFVAKEDQSATVALMAAALDETRDEVAVDISRTGTELTYTVTKAGEKKTVTLVPAAESEQLPETLNVYLTGQNCTLSDIAVEAGKEPEPMGENLTVTDFFVNKSSFHPLKSGESYTITFHNKSNGTDNYNNFVLAVVDNDGTTEYPGAEKEILIVRADNWGWGGGMSDFVVPDAVSGNILHFDTDINWVTFVSEANAGFDVEITIGRTGNTLSYSAKLGTYTVTMTTAASSKTLPETVYVFLTGEKCELTNIVFTPGTDAPEAVEPNVTPAPTPSVPLIPFVPDDPVDGVKEVEKLEGNLNINNFFNRKTGAVALKSGESLTLTFKNRSNGLENWNNYVLAVVGATGTPYPGAEKEILIIRADSYGWGGGMSDFSALNFTNNVEDWDAFKTDARAGMDVEILIERVDDTIHYLAKMGKYTFELTATSSMALPETAYVFLTGEKVSLTGIASVKGEAGDIEPVKPHTPETTEKIEGDLTVDGFLAAKSVSIPLRDGGEYTFKFHAKSNGDLNWNNFLLGVTTGSEDVVLIRADSYGWGSGTYFPTMDQVAAGEAIPFENNVTDWAAFVAAAQAGFDVEITLKREGDTLTYSAKMGDYTVAMTSAAKKALPETVYVFLSGEKCELTGITTEGDPGKAPAEPVDPQPTDPEPTDPEPTDPEPTDPEPTDPEPTEPEPTTPEETYTPKIEGKLDVDVFFSAKTNMVPLRSGESYTFTFTNTSKGTANWDNFILAVVGATGKAYTGADQEILIVRADNYGWGGGMSDFARPGDPGNALAFESNINWDEWVAACKAGLPVTVTISRKGDTLTYEAKIGEWFVKLTAASGKALPATAYVFLTGENCTLSDIKTVSAPTYTSPKTGDTGTVGIWAAVLAVLATLAAAAVVVTKRYGRR